MTWQPHLKLILSSSKESITHNFMKSDPDKKEIINAFDKLKNNFKESEILTAKVGY
jgi:hypothetical protein